MSTWDVKGKVAIVTGAGSGINHAFAAQLLNAGCSVLFADLALRPEAEATLVTFPHPAKDGSPSAVFHKTDQSNWAQVSETWEFALETFGRVDLLCPGAGVWEPPHSAFWNAPGISPLSRDDPNGSPGVYHILAVNTMGPIRFAPIAIDYWLENKIAGNLLFVSSMSAYMPTIGTPLYNASKGAITNFAQSLAQMRSRLNIRVSVICPATTFTPAVEKDYCKEKVRDCDMNMTADECAKVMMRVVAEPQYGDGHIVEAMQFGTRENPDVRTRLVPYSSLMPSIDPNGEFSGKNIIVEEEKLWEQLKTKGMRP